MSGAGRAAFILNGTPGEEVFDRAAMFVGSDGSGSIKVFGGGKNRNGVFVDAGEGRLPSMSVYDSAGREVEVRDLAGHR